jgi:hypothetical protein
VRAAGGRPALPRSQLCLEGQELTDTPNQLAAREALAEAIEKANAAFDMPGLPVATLVCQLVVEYNDKGEQSSGVQFHVPDGQHWGMTLGTLRAAQLYLERQFLEMDDEP